MQLQQSAVDRTTLSSSCPLRDVYTYAEMVKYKLPTFLLKFDHIRSIKKSIQDDSIVNSH